MVTVCKPTDAFPRSLLVLCRERGLLASGWLRSLLVRRPLDREGNPLPWITYPALEFLEPRISPAMRIFEYGSGNSTLWWAKRVSLVVSCEHDYSWYQNVRSRIPGNVRLNYRELSPGGEYSRMVATYRNEFDIIVIDGRDRNNCAKQCLPALKADGVILWDNSDRDSYTEGFRFLLDSGFSRIDFPGMGPVNLSPWCTSLFYREENCFGIRGL